MGHRNLVPNLPQFDLVGKWIPCEEPVSQLILGNAYSKVCFGGIRNAILLTEI